MSIVTKTGDSGTTSLMFNRRVSKCHPRVEAGGSVDELNSALGLARAMMKPDSVASKIKAVQADLVGLMGELATSLEDASRYQKAGFARITPQLTSRLEQWIREAESQQSPFGGWAIPGANLSSAALDMARTICRRAERRICALREAGELPNAELMVYLNRLGDLLWLWARHLEGQPAKDTSSKSE
ncbi:MAG: cob(I)yrinic acid a,c-diamide adenosyltransferase [Candidatus Omnitrophica bacterium]|nr:cob(I)yrinic acid a,c-diamide adenosyltransferase [Candidatus Omnitrophota bacterium]